MRSLLLLLVWATVASAQIRGGARPQMPQNRPQVPMPQRPSFTPPATRPNVQIPQTRPTIPQVPQVRPNLPPTAPVRPNPPQTLPGVKPGLVPQPRPTPQPTPVPRPNLPKPVTPLPSVPTVKPPLPGVPNTRPPGVLQPGVLPSRPNVNINNGNRPVWNNNVNNNNFNRNVINNNNFNVIAPTIYNPSRPYGGYFKPYYGGVYRPYGWANYGNGFMWGNYYAARYYTGWHAGYWGGLWFPPGFVPRPVPLGWLLPPTVVWNYYNPYYIAPPPTVVVNQVFNYSQPLPVTDTVANAPIDTPVAVAPKTDDTKEKKAAQIFDLARAQFAKGEYAAAEKTIDDALTLLPTDPTLHEFRALTLFAQGKFVESAAAVYAVLAAGPGWNADTLYSLYPGKLIYAKQLAQLEATATANPTNGALQFLLGYHYLTLGDKAKAEAAFAAAVKAQPKDELSTALLKNLREPQP